MRVLDAIKFVFSTEMKSLLKYSGSFKAQTTFPVSVNCHLDPVISFYFHEYWLCYCSHLIIFVTTTHLFCRTSMNIGTVHHILIIGPNIRRLIFQYYVNICNVKSLCPCKCILNDYTKS